MHIYLLFFSAEKLKEKINRPEEYIQSGIKKLRRFEALQSTIDDATQNLLGILYNKLHELFIILATIPSYFNKKKSTG